MTNRKRVKFNYPATPDMVERYRTRGRKPSDEMYLEAINTMVPRPLSSVMHAVLTKELDPTIKRSGRPSGTKASRHEVADYIEQIDRDDFPSGFRNALVARLRSGKRFSNFDRSKPLHKHLEKSRRNMTIKYLYPLIYDLIKKNEKAVYFEPLGVLDIPSDQVSRSMKAMTIVNNAMTKLEMDPPAVPRMFNIMSEIPRPFRE